MKHILYPLEEKTNEIMNGIRVRGKKSWDQFNESEGTPKMRHILQQNIVILTKKTNTQRVSVCLLMRWTVWIVSEEMAIGLCSKLKYVFMFCNTIIIGVSIFGFIWGNINYATYWPVNGSFIGGQLATICVGNENLKFKVY
jgi:hypothetical protein